MENWSKEDGLKQDQNATTIKELWIGLNIIGTQARHDEQQTRRDEPTTRTNYSIHSMKFMKGDMHVSVR